jgi:hypothetical protein
VVKVVHIRRRLRHNKLGEKMNTLASKPRSELFKSFTSGDMEKLEETYPSIMITFVAVASAGISHKGKTSLEIQNHIAENSEKTFHVSEIAKALNYLLHANLVYVLHGQNQWIITDQGLREYIEMNPIHLV